MNTHHRAWRIGSLMLRAFITHVGAIRSKATDLAALITLLTVASLPSTASAANPVLPGYNADPAMYYFAGKYWIYPTAQEVNSYSQFHAFSSPDMVNWTDEGVVLNSQNVPWTGTKDCWAPAVAFRNNTYYFYFSVDGSGSDSKIGVATGPTPKGPFTDALGQALIYTTVSPHSCEAIDPSVFIDDDGQAYLAYGGMWGWKPGIVKLNADMISLNGTSTIFMSGFTGYTEGPCLTKRNGIYYLSYSSGQWFDGTYNVRYSTASSPMGPWTYKGQIMVSDATRKGPGGHTFMQVPNSNHWRICYHYWDAAMSARHTAIDYLGYNSDGTIRQIIMTGGNGLGDNRTFRIRNRHSGHVLGALTGNANSTPLTQDPWAGGTNQDWVARSAGSGQYCFTGVASSRAVDVPGWTTADTQLKLWDYNASAAQKFTVAATSDGFCRLTNVNSGKVMEVLNQSTASGAAVYQSTWWGGNNQQWMLLQK